MTARAHPDVDTPHVHQQHKVTQTTKDLKRRVVPNVLAEVVVGDAIPRRPSLHKVAKTKKEKKRKKK